MNQSLPPPKSVAALLACTILVALLLVALAATSVSLSASTVFDSPVQPSRTPKPSAPPRPTRTPRAMPTLSAFMSPLQITPTPTLIPRVWLPLVRQDCPSSRMRYGWKGMGRTISESLGASYANGFLGICPDWWYNWTYDYQPTGGLTTATNALASIQAGLPDPFFVPMVWCMHEVSPLYFPSPTKIADLARQYPGRIWLMFNELDNWTAPPALPRNDGCGDPIFAIHPEWFDGAHWETLGQYLAQQYLLYYHAIKSADPTAQVFTPALLTNPMPTLSGSTGGDRAARIWNSFLDNFGGPYLDGIAIHTYPAHVSTTHSGCSGYTDPACVQTAIQDIYRFVQGADGTPSQNRHPDYTRDKGIWITEIGILKKEEIVSWNQTRDNFEIPMLTWFQGNISRIGNSGGPYEWINAVGWFSTHYPDASASSLLNYHTGNALSPVGQAWKDSTCPACACPGVQCP